MEPPENWLRYALYINLDSRPDRNTQFLTQITQLREEVRQQWGDAVANVMHCERFSARKTSDGAIGCTLSHIACLELARQRGWPHVAVLEDDILFLHPARVVAKLKHYAEHISPDTDWDVLILGGNVVPPYGVLPAATGVSEDVVRLTEVQTTTGYVVRSHYYATLIANMREGLALLMRHPGSRRDFAVDVYWKRLQLGDRWYMVWPPSVSQQEGYSDIEARLTNYDHLMLDAEKPWLRHFVRAKEEAMAQTPGWYSHAAAAAATATAATTRDV